MHGTARGTACNIQATAFLSALPVTRECTSACIARRHAAHCHRALAKAAALPRERAPGCQRARLTGPCAQGLALGDSELREYTHGMFGHIARMLGPDFQPYLRACVAAAVESCGQARHLPPALLTACARFYADLRVQSAFFVGA